MLHHDDDSTQSDDSDLTLECVRSTILHQLANRDEDDVDVELVAIAVWNREIENRELNPDDLNLQVVQERIANVHLPALDREEVVEFDRTDGTIALAVSPDELEASFE